MASSGAREELMAVGQEALGKYLGTGDGIRNGWGPARCRDQGRAMVSEGGRYYSGKNEAWEQEERGWTVVVCVVGGEHQGGLFLVENSSAGWCGEGKRRL
ncbi:unnamed protein product [Calypogeia fissa]